MSYIIIVKVERVAPGELMVRNQDGRHQRRMAMTAEIEQMLGHRTMMFAEARVKADGQLLILRRGRDRTW